MSLSRCCGSSTPSRTSTTCRTSGPTSTSPTRSSSASASPSPADAELAPDGLAAVPRLDAPASAEHLEQPQPAAGRHLRAEPVAPQAHRLVEVGHLDDEPVGRPLQLD